MKQRIIVLGAAGFIGQRVVSALAATPGTTTLAAYHRSVPQVLRAKLVKVDATSESELRLALADVDGVVNCVAGGADTISATAVALFSVAKTLMHPPTIVHLSTMSVYGSATGDVDESRELKGDLGPYSVAKVQAERLAATYGPTVILRPSCIYGPGSLQWSLRIARLLKEHRIGDLGAGGDGTCNLVYVDDLVAAVLRSLDTPDAHGQVFNLSGPERLTWNDYFLGFARALGAVPLRRISHRRLVIETKFLAAPLKIIELLQAKTGIVTPRFPQPIPPSLRKLWQQDIRIISDKAQQTLMPKFTALEEGLRATAEWFRRSGAS